MGYKLKKNPNFDLTVGSIDGTVVCELVVLYFLDVLKKEVGNN